LEEKVFQGDCLEIVPTLENNSIDLIYLDPPFFTNKIQKLSSFSYSDIWSSSSEYGEFLYKRILEFKRVLKNDGNIFVHCDRNATHIIKAILDEVFGEDNFQSEIIWYYKRWSNSKKGLLNSHQTIYFYSKTKNFKFKTIYKDYSETTNLDQILQKRKKEKNGKSVYAKNENGEIILDSQKKGVPLNDVWEIPYLNPKAKERVGYPTQKPIELLERIIEIGSNKGDTILDPFCGSGTTLVAGKLQNRKVIGIDISEDAVGITKKRLENLIKTESNLLKKGRKSYENTNEFVKKHLFGVEYSPIQRNSGADGILKKSYKDAPVFIRVQQENETLEEAISKLFKVVESKKSKKSFLIRTNFKESLFKVENEKIEIVDSVSYKLNKQNF
jgi:site-specific DNA-methyltransferase (adenine-specific)